jgi:hypothetical protein
LTLGFSVQLFLVHFFEMRSMKKKDLSERLRIAKQAMLAVNDHEARALRRKLFPAELVKVAKRDAEKLLDAIEVFQLPKARRSPVAECVAGGPQFYADQIKAAEAILEIIAELRDPIRIIMTFRDAFPKEFADIRCLPSYTRCVIGVNRVDKYYFYRRGVMETRLPDDPCDPAFMHAYHKAERAYQASNLHQTYHARPQVGEMAIAA